MRNDTMTPRQRWLALFNRQSPDRIPTDFWTTSDFERKLMNHAGVFDHEALYRKLHIDRPRFFSPALKRSTQQVEGVDHWGVRYEAIAHATGSYVEAVSHPLASVETVEQLNAWPWPDPDLYEYDVMAAALEQDDGYRLRVAGSYEPFLLYCRLRGMEQAFEDLLLAPDLAHAALDRLFEYFAHINRRTWEMSQGRLDMISLAEDLGSQHGPLFSLDTYRKFLLTNQLRMAQLAKEYGLRVFYHTDGAVAPFLPDLINVVGIDVLNPIQWRCAGMDREQLMADWGDRVIFHGAIDNQHTLAFGSITDVEEEVRQTAEIFAGGRWICAPCHNVQSVSPPENIVAMYQTVVAVSKGRNACIIASQ